MSYSLSELGVAFRKAKVDLYYSNNPSLFAIADYEENLAENLQRLQKKINGRSIAWMKGSDFLGTWTLAVKAIQYLGKDAGLIYASVGEEWASRSKAESKWIQAKYSDIDDCMVAQSDMSASRQLKSSWRYPEEVVKPVAGGFAADISKDRSVLPEGERNEPERKNG